MAKKITELPDYPDPQPDDPLTIVDLGEGVSKKVTVENLLGQKDQWQELGRTVTTAVGDEFTVALSEAKRYLKFYLQIKAEGGDIGVMIKFNGDSSVSYARRFSQDSTDDDIDPDETGIGVTSVGAYTGGAFIKMDIVNSSFIEKLCFFESVYTFGGASDIPGRREGVAKWVGTDQIVSISVSNDRTGSYSVGSEIVVFGRD